MIRLFTAIQIPESEQDRLAALEVPMPGARWIAMDDMHLTLRFVGDVEEPVAEAFVDELAAIRLAPFTLSLDGIGAFGGDKPRSLHATVAPSTALVRLQAKHEQAARAAECPPETRRFTPHVTIARLGGTRADDVARFLGRCGAARGAPFEVDSFVLMSSRPGRGGGPYIVEAKFPLTVDPLEPEAA
ncbi:MAG: RNA 2',3'-cyclic phosphodiesterase [Rhizobiales bacterium]|nr:RNA 2',3'-cyclic phosphodiesterase [Hyphomicrobiales bacterium]